MRQALGRASLPRALGQEWGRGRAAAFLGSVARLVLTALSPQGRRDLLRQDPAAEAAGGRGEAHGHPGGRAVRGRGPSCPRSPPGLCERVPRSVDPEGSGEEPVSGSLNPAHLSPRPESSSLCAPAPRPWHHPEPSAEGQGEGSEGLTSSSRASRGSLGVTSCRAPHRHPPGPTVPSWPGLAGRRPRGRFRDLGWLAGPPTVTGQRPGRSCSWGCGSRLHARAHPLGPPGLPGTRVPRELSCLGCFCPASHHRPGPASLLHGAQRCPSSAPAGSPGSLTTGWACSGLWSQHRGRAWKQVSSLGLAGRASVRGSGAQPPLLPGAWGPLPPSGASPRAAPSLCFQVDLHLWGLLGLAAGGQALS